MKTNSDYQENAIKEYMHKIVAETNKYPILYKYLTFDSAYLMLKNQNIQFTTRAGLNDKSEFNIKKCNLSNCISILRDCGVTQTTIDNKLAEIDNKFASTGVCSLGKTPTNQILWDTYAHAPNSSLIDGVCIGINQDKVLKRLNTIGHLCMALLVNYIPDVEKFIPWELYLGNKLETTIFLHLLYTTKEKAKWESEQEVRFILADPVSGQHLRIPLNSNCFTDVYFGKDMSNLQRKKLGQILNRLKINRHT